eukprot:scpid61371/ scgid34352/ MFS-type transporter SLC18B1; Solute carrier family 18 member B1
MGRSGVRLDPCLLDLKVKQDSPPPLEASESRTSTAPTAGSHDQGTPRKYSWRRLLLGACVVANIGSIALAIGILFPFLTEEVLKAFPTGGIGRHLVVGALFSTTTIVEAVVAPVTATDLHNAGEKNVLVLSSFLVGGAMMLFGFVNQIKSWTAFVPLAITIRVVQGVGSGANFTAAYALLATTFPESTGKVNGVIRAVNGFGYAVGPAIGGFLYDAGGFGLPCFAIASLVIITSLINVILLVFNGEKPPSRDDAAGQDSTHAQELRRAHGKSTVTFKSILCYPWIWVSLSMIALGITMVGLIESTLSHYMKLMFGTSSSEGGLALLLCASLFAIASFLCGYALDRWIQPRNMCLFGLCLGSFSFLLYGPASFLPIAPSVAFAFIATIPYGMAGAILMTSGPEDMMRTLRRRGVGDASGMGAYVGAVNQVSISFFYTPGLLLGPILSASIGVRELSSILTAVYFIFAVLYLIAHVRTWRTEKQLEASLSEDADHQPSNGGVTPVSDQTETIPLVNSQKRSDSCEAASSVTTYQQ